jgi:hypothetical protein
MRNRTRFAALIVLFLSVSLCAQQQPFDIAITHGALPGKVLRGPGYTP